MKMKLAAAVTAAALMMALFAGCKDDKDATSSAENPPSNIESFAKVGRVDTLNVKVGDSVESVCEFYGTTLEAIKLQAEKEASNAAMSAPPTEDDEDSGDASENESSGDSGISSGISSDSDDNVQMSSFDISYSSKNNLGKLTAEGVFYYYNELLPENGIILIVAFEDPYLLTVGASTPDIVKAMVEDKPKYSGDTEEGDWFFIFGEPSESAQKIIYSFDKYDVQFMFQEDLLFCVMLYDAELWAQANGTSTASSAGTSSQAESE